MPITLKNDATEVLARRVAEMTGESLTEAIRVSLADRYERLNRERAGISLADELNEIALSCARLPVKSGLTPDGVLGYDDMGIPTR